MTRCCNMVTPRSAPPHLGKYGVERGQRYFVERGTPAIGPKFVIREVVCAVAQDMGQRTKPSEPVHMRPGWRADPRYRRVLSRVPMRKAGHMWRADGLPCRRQSGSFAGTGS